MKETKTQKGITLIALIITIVVLLILAGVAIGSLDKSNIIGRATEAATEYEKRQEEENTLLKDFEALLETDPTAKVYGTKELYLIDSKQGTVCLNTNTENVAIYLVEKKGIEDSKELVSSDMLDDLKEIEEEYKSKSKYVLFLENQPAGVIFENDTVFFRGELLSYNESLTAELGKDKKDVNCYKMELMGVETLIAIDHSAKQYTAVAIGVEEPEPPQTKSYEERRVEEAKTITVYGVSGQETVDIDEGMPYIIYDAAEGDDVVLIEFEDYVLWTTSIEAESAMKYTKADEKDILKLGMYYK